MIVTFEKEYLKELYETGKKYRFQPEIIRGYAKCIYRMQEANDIEDLLKFRSLRYEELKGDKKGLSSVRVNDKYRIEFTISALEEEETIFTVCNIVELSNHYQ